AGAFRAVEAVVDGDDVPSGRVQQGRRDRGAHAARAVDPDLAVGDLGEPSAQGVQRDVDRSPDVPGRAFGVAADVEDDDLFVREPAGEVGEGGPREGGGRLAVAQPLRRTAGGRRGRAVDADP